MFYYVCVISFIIFFYLTATSFDELPIITLWVCPLSFLVASEVILKFYFIFAKANRIAPDGTPCSAASHLGLYCLHMSHKKGRQAYVS